MNIEQAKRSPMNIGLSRVHYQMNKVNKMNKHVHNVHLVQPKMNTAKHCISNNKTQMFICSTI